MNIKENLIKARGSLVFLIGLTVAFGTVFSLERWNPVPADGVVRAAPVIDLKVNQLTDLPKLRVLTDEEMQYAEIAWQYFVKNTNGKTGLVNSVSQYPAATLWDTSSYLLGLISAYKLGLVETAEFNQRTEQLLETLATMPLFDDRLPNKSYSVVNGAMVTYDNEDTERGIGWSAIDIGRILVPFNVLVWRYPEFTRDVNQVLANWDLSAIAKNAEMMGAAVDENAGTLILQEGRLGYEEYAAKSLMLTGMDVSQALDYQAHFKYVEISGVDIGTDLRTSDKFDALSAVVSEPYVLDGLEFGWDRYSRSLADGVYRVQQARYEETGILTAVSEDNIDQAPYFVYNTVFANGKPWNAVTESGVDASAYRSVSTKTAFGLHALYRSDYTRLLIDHIKTRFDPEEGWYSGVYEATGNTNKSLTANTNGIILESLHYIQFGPLMSLGQPTQMAISEE